VSGDAPILVNEFETKTFDVLAGDDGVGGMQPLRVRGFDTTLRTLVAAHIDITATTAIAAEFESTNACAACCVAL
jgi:hypothetical protein